MARWILLVLVVLTTGACARRADPIFGTGPDGERTITLEVANRNFSDATIWAFRYSERRRVGVVIGKGNETLRLRWATTAPLRLEIRLRPGGAVCRTREIQAEPGDVIRFDIPVDVRTDPECAGRS